MVLRNHVSAIDELGMATERLRVRLPDEPKPKLPHIIEPHEVSSKRLTLYCMSVVHINYTEPSQRWFRFCWSKVSRPLTSVIAFLTSASLLFFQVEQNRVKLLNDQAVAKSQLQKKLGQFLYLTNLEKVIYISKATKRRTYPAGQSAPCHHPLIVLQLTKLSLTFPQSQDKSTGGLNPEPCPICARPLGQEVSAA